MHRFWIYLSKFPIHSGGELKSKHFIMDEFGFSLLFFFKYHLKTVLATLQTTWQKQIKGEGFILVQDSGESVCYRGEGMAARAAP